VKENRDFLGGEYYSGFFFFFNHGIFKINQLFETQVLKKLPPYYDGIENPIHGPNTGSNNWRFCFFAPKMASMLLLFYFS
jgi:hypothetical protein